MGSGRSRVVDRPRCQKLGCPPLGGTVAWGISASYSWAYVDWANPAQSTLTNNLAGDYSRMAIDPTDDCAFWYTNEYYRDFNPASVWLTQVATFKYPSCQSKSVADPR